jgi:hypothetical protein
LTVIVEMKGKLEPIKLDGTFMDVVNSLNLSAATGKALILGRLDDTGENIALQMSNILTVTENDGEETGLPSAI